ncbi:unnamed protein product [Effrenium voratum]|nr:unnamed protein product [Effrenium voratum]
MLTSNRLAVLQDVGNMAIVREAIPVPGPGEVLVRVTHAGLCGSDLHYFRHGGLGTFKVDLPMYMGHEPAGIIADANGCEGWQLGDRVAVVPNCPCLSSRMAMQGKQHLCEQGTFMGAGGVKGCFADFVCVSTLQLVRVPAHVPLDLAMMTEPLSVALHTLKLAQASIFNILDGDVAIMGAGAIGLCHLLLLKHMGARHVHMIEPLEERRELAKRLGAASAVGHPGRGAERPGGRKGCELVLDCAGTEQSFNIALQVAGLAAQVVLVGIPEVDFLKYNPHVARTKELTLLNARRANQTLAPCLDLLARSEALREKCLCLVTHHMPLANIQEAFEMASSYTGGAVKIAILPENEAHSFRSVGLIGGTPHSVEYLRHLKSEGLEVKFVAIAGGNWPQEAKIREELQELCRLHGIPCFDVKDVPANVQDMQPDLLIDAGFSVDGPTASCLPAALRCTTVLGLGRPLGWALLAGEAPGCASFIGEDRVVDIFTEEIGFPCGARKAFDLLSRRAAQRFPQWLRALRSGDYDMSMLKAWRSATAGAGQTKLSRSGAAPNNGWVSWRWRGGFIHRFALSLELDPRGARASRADGRGHMQRRARQGLGEELLASPERLKVFAGARPGEAGCPFPGVLWQHGEKRDDA